jgi:prefoldin subunit 5
MPSSNHAIDVLQKELAQLETSLKELENRAAEEAQKAQDVQTKIRFLKKALADIRNS